jgi:hypothetical protein
MLDSVSLLDPPLMLPLAADPLSVVPVLAPELELDPIDPEDPAAIDTPNALAVLLSSWPVTERFSDC